MTVSDFPRSGLWQWQDWRWPRFSHQFTTRTIWRPGFVPFRNMAWQPDVSGWTLGRFGFDALNWARQRNTDPSRILFDMNSGSTVQISHTGDAT